MIFAERSGLSQWVTIFHISRGSGRLNWLRHILWCNFDFFFKYSHRFRRRRHRRRPFRLFAFRSFSMILTEKFHCSFSCMRCHVFASHAISRAVCVRFSSSHCCYCCWREAAINWDKLAKWLYDITLRIKKKEENEKERGREKKRMKSRE